MRVATVLAALLGLLIVANTHRGTAPGNTPASSVERPMLRIRCSEPECFEPADEELVDPGDWVDALPWSPIDW